MVPDARVAADYHEAIGSPGFPVMADVDGLALTISPYVVEGVPGKCALAPDMTILGCTEGHGAEVLLEMIREHAAAP